MITFTSLIFKNFLSFGNAETTVNLNNPGTTLIVGKDLDNTSDGQGSNGVGKSTIINALTYALYDKTISSISKDNLVNNINKKHMEVIVAFEKDGKTYQVKRTRKMKAGAEGNAVHLIEDGKDITIGNSETNALIEKILGISYDVFIRIVVFSASQTPFLDLPFTHPSYANQTDIIEELFDLTSISEKADSLKEMIKEIEQKIELRNVRIKDLEEEHKRHTQQLDSAKKRVVQWTRENELQITDFNEQLKLVKNINTEEQEQLLNKKEELQKKKQELETTIKNETTVLEHNIKAKREISNQINHHKNIEKEYKTDIQKLDTQKNNLFKQIAHLKEGKCPMCLQTFPDAKVKINELEKNILTVDKECEHKNQALKNMVQPIELETQLKIANDNYEKYTKTISDERTKVTQFERNLKELNKNLIVQTRDELYKLKSQETILQNKITELEQAQNPFIEPLEELENIKLDVINYDELNQLTKKVEHQKFLHKLLTKKDSFVRKVLINKNIPYLNNRLQHYLTIIGLPHKVEFTHEMICVITQFGRELDFGNLSAGQQARVNLALSFAFRDVLENLHTHVNICMMDEVLDHALDSIGLQAAARLLKRKARDEHLSLFIISHRNEIGHSFDRTLTVELNKGFSSIKEN